MNALSLQHIYANESVRLLSFSDGCGDYAHPVFGKGDNRATVMFIGEAPGKSEAESGTPFVGAAGAQLDEMLSAARIDRKLVFVTNAVKFRPTKSKQTKAGKLSVSNRTPTRTEILSSLSVLAAEIELISPRIIVTLGNTPLFSVLTLYNKYDKSTVGECHGKKLELDESTVLFPLYHPASGIYRRELIAIMQNDLIELGNYIRNKNNDNAE